MVTLGNRTSHGRITGTPRVRNAIGAARNA